MSLGPGGAAVPVFHDSLLVIDGHCDSLLDLVGLPYARPPGRTRDLLAAGGHGHLNLPALEAGRVGCQVFALFTEDRYVHEARAHIWRLLEAAEGLFARTDRLVLARGAGDILAARAAGRVAALLSMEGAEALGDEGGRSLDELGAFHARGLRMLGLTWNRRNALGRGAGTGTGADGSGGLTELGRRVVREAEKLGIVVDASHLSDEALDELLTVAERPVVASHSNSRELCGHRRNLSDRQAEAIAATGGLVACTFAGIFIDPVPARVTKERFLEHLEHLVALLGPGHVGLGSDFDGFSDEDGQAFSSPAELPWITGALLSRGHSREDVARIMGGNWLRVIAEICG